MAAAPMFKKAVKYDAKGRVALIGPAGSGKSFTALKLARFLVGPDGKIAAVDTEHGSLSKYADVFDFDVIELDSYSPANFLECLHAAEAAGYSAFVCDSLSHFWMGKDGALEFVDVAKKRSSSRDDMAGWKEFRPHEREMVDAILASPCHVVCTMRTKTAYVEQEYTNARGEKKTKRVKVGLAPVQRDGLEYEFDLVGTLDDENTLIVDKSRCSDLSGRAIDKPGEKDFAPFKAWLSGTKREASASGPVPVPTPSHQRNTPEQQAELAQRRIAEEQARLDAQRAEKAKAQAPPQPVDDTPTAVKEIWGRMTGAAAVVAEFQALKKELVTLVGTDAAAEIYRQVLAEHGVEHSNQFRTSKPAKAASLSLWRAIQKEKEAAAAIPPDAPFQASDDDLPPILQGGDK